MKRLTLLRTLAVALLSAIGWLPASAVWVKNETPITTGNELSAGMQIVLTNVCNAGAMTKYLSAPALDYVVHNDMVETKYVFQLDEAGTNPYTAEPMWYIKSVLTGKYFNGVGFYANAEDALPITFGSAQKTTLLEKGEGWTEDDPVWPNDQKIPAWDWKDGDALTILHYTSATSADYLYHIWGWNNYPKAGWGSAIDPTDINTSTAVNPWYAYSVEWQDNPLEDLSLLIQKCTDADYTSIYMPGEGMGFCDSTAVSAYLQALEDAQAKLADVSATDEQLKAAYTHLENTLAGLQASLRTVEDGHYYFIISAYAEYEKKQGVQKGWYADATAFKWTTHDPYALNQVFKFVEQPDGTFAIQSVKTEKYLNGYTAVSDTPATTQSVYPLGNGRFYIKNGVGPTTGSTDGYHTNGHASGNGKSGTLVGWYTNSDATMWKFVELTDLARLDTMKQIDAQRVITEAFNAKLQEARADSAAGYHTKFYIKKATQFSSNALDENVASYAALIDGKYNTMFHTWWTKPRGEAHYLQVDVSDTPLQKFSMYWKKRDYNNYNRPVRMTILASNDGENFEVICPWPQAPDTLPTAASHLEYFSPEVDLGAAYKYIRFQIDSTNNNQLDNSYMSEEEKKENPGYPFVSFSEFNISDPGFPIDSESMGFRPDMIDAYAALKAAIDAALQKNPATVKEEDVQALADAITAFNKVYPDTTVLSNAIARSTNYTADVLVAEPSQAQMGMCTDQSKVDGLITAIASARNALDANPKMTRSEIDAQVAALQTANDAFLGSIVMPEAGKWYFMKSVCTEREDGTYGSLVYPNSHEIGAQIRWGDDVSVGAMNPKYLWQFVPVEGKENVFGVRNVGSGFYLGADRGLSTAFLLSDTVVEYKIDYVGSGQLTLIENREGAHMTHAQASGSVLVPWNSASGSASSWTFEESEDQVAEVIAFNNRAQIYCLPYGISGAFYAYSETSDFEDEPKAYTITDAKYDENRNITEIGLSELNTDNGIAAGTPFILVLGDAASDERGDTIHIDLGLVIESEISTEARTDNGLTGVLRSTVIDKAGTGFFTEAAGLTTLTEGKKATVAAQTGYIDGKQLKATGEAELYIAVKGGTITDIAQAVRESRQMVTVYTADGQLVRKNVKASEALKGLKKGIYVVNGKVVIVP